MRYMSGILTANSHFKIDAIKREQFNRIACGGCSFPRDVPDLECKEHAGIYF